MIDESAYQGHSTELKKNDESSTFLLPASQFSGLLGSGFVRRELIATHTDSRFHDGVHSDLRISKQISPV